MAAELSDRAEAHIALGHARRHLRTHMDWAEHLKAGGALPHERIGDLAHHEEAIRNYNLICKVLRRACDQKEHGHVE